MQLSLYAQHRKYRSTFSSINETRAVETPALNQFDVPATAAGGSAVWSMTAGKHEMTAGSDVRWVEGETNEAYLWNGTEFTRLRNAGGGQLFAGIFGEDDWSPNDYLTIIGGLRYDHWELFNGFRKASDRATGAVTLDSQFPDRSGDEINGRIGARAKLKNE